MTSDLPKKYIEIYNRVARRVQADGTLKRVTWSDKTAGPGKKTPLSEALWHTTYAGGPRPVYSFRTAWKESWGGFGRYWQEYFKTAETEMPTTLRALYTSSWAVYQRWKERDTPADLVRKAQKK